jgi:hypothetical protein
MKHRKERSDSVAGQIKNRVLHETTILVPEGIELITDEEKKLWEHYTAARDSETWRDSDLLQVWKIVKYDIQIRKLHAQIELEGIMVDGIANPAFKMLNMVQRLQLSLFSSLSLGIRGADAVAINNSGKSAVDKAADKERKSQMSLLAH